MTAAATNTAEASAPLPWWRGRMLGLDFESTAPDPLVARPVQCALVLVGGGLEPVKHTWLIDAGVDIPAEASAIHGITTADVKVHGHPVEHVFAEVVELLREHWTEHVPAVLMNAPYDLTLLAAELRRHGGRRFELPGPVVDVKVLDKQADTFEGYHRRGSRKLDALCSHYGAQLEKAHDATSDAIAACRVAYRIGQRYPAIGNQSLGNLMALQREWHREQMEGLDAYFKKQGKPGVDSFEWPVREAPR